MSRLHFPFDPTNPAASLVRPDHPALHAPTEPVDPRDPDLRRSVERLIAVCLAADGVGIAANQVGLSVAVAVIAPPSSEEGSPRPAPIVLLNPEVVVEAGERVWAVEGCLSLPCLHGAEVRRPESIEVRADDLHGARRRLRAEGFMAEIVSHETDHLMGRLYPERAERLVYTPNFRIRGAR